jgi:signal transduction histidine kinase
MLRSLDAARAETESALSRQREFVADASHELRTPLTAVLANLELLEEELSGDQRETAGAALRSTQRMRRLVGDLLLLARADAGREAPRVPVDLRDVLVEAAAELEPVAADHELTVSATPGAVVEGARDELHRLVLNLLDNAIKHTEPGTAIRARAERRDGEVVLAVEDEGPGVPADIAPKIFDRFVRGASDRGGSSGLGLSIVRAVAETHGGSVALEPGQIGARFVVRLPAHAAEPALSTETVSA